MKQAVLPQKEVANYLDKHFIPVMLEINDDRLPKGFSYYATPTFFVVSPDGKSVERVVGGANASQFLDYLKKVRTRIK